MSRGQRLSRFLLALEDLPFHVETIFLFGRSDLKTVLMPVAGFAFGAAPLCPSRPVLHASQALLWTWLHTLQFNLLNQTRDLAEDEINKPWRPLPSGRITVREALMLLKLCTAACLFLSLSYNLNVLLLSAFFLIQNYAYNELKGDRHWLVRNIVNALGYFCFTSGATHIARCNYSSPDRIGWSAIISATAIIAFTLQAQDFQDLEGDRLVGRKTIPILWPSLSRYTPIITLVISSISLHFLWDLDYYTSLSLLSFAVYIGARYYLFRTKEGDERSYVLYNVWLLFSFAVPGYYRLSLGNYS